MGIVKFVDFDIYLNRVKIKESDHLLHILAKEVAPSCSVSANMLEDVFINRAASGGICVENGIAIFDMTSRFVKNSVSVIATIEWGIDFQAPDNRQVDLFVAVISPSNKVSAHLQHLSAIVRLFRSDDLCKALRNSRSVDEMKVLFMPTQDWIIAA